MSDLDKLIREYASEAARIYEERTAGEYTWEGLLSQFLREGSEIIKNTTERV